jgi:DNA-binding HxlR family transcriptional regulator
MQKHSLAELPCPVARSLDIVGEWWTLLIVRDAVRGARRFEDFRALGAADNILSVRLKKLVDEGIFEKRLYSNHPERYEYVLTEKGNDLRIVLAAIATWGTRWTSGKDNTRLTHGATGHRVTMQALCEECGHALSQDELTMARLPAAEE